MKRKIHYYIVILLLCCVALTAKGQVAESNSGNYWIHATGTKYINMDFINTSTGVWMNNGEVWYKGNFTNNGTADFDNSLVVNPGLSHFEGTANQVLSGSGATRFYNVLFSSQLTVGAFSLQQNIRVAHHADFTKGIVTSLQTTPETMMNMVTLENGAASVNASDVSHVDGFVSKIGNSAFTFPIGNGGYYRQASISAPVNATDEFAAKYIFSNPASVGSLSSKDASISQISNKEYWVVQQRAGTSNVQLTLSWDVSKTSATISSNLSKLIIVRWDGTKWVNEGNIATTGNTTSGTITANVTGYGEFTLGMVTLEPPLINPVTDVATTVTGKGEPGATVTVTYPNGDSSTATVQPDGTWTSTIPSTVDLNGGDIVTAKQTDPSGNTSGSATTTVIDTTAPTVPTINPVTDVATTITGKGEPGATVTVTYPNGDSSTATVQPDGTWTSTIPSTVDLNGGDIVTAKQTDPSGNTSGSATTTVIDTTAPTVPTINPVTDVATTITGKGEPGATVTVTYPNGDISTATVQPDGTWTSTIPSTVDLNGGDIVTAKQTDPSGNTSGSATTTVIDTTAPTVPTINPVTDVATTITGKGEPGATVTVTYPNGDTSTATVQPDGTWTSTIPSTVDLNGGDIVTAKQTDPSGNTSGSATTTVIDTTAPTVPTINPVTDVATTITGKGEPGATVTVTYPNGDTSTATVQPDGTWTSTIPSTVDLNGGDIVTAKQTDPSGNTSGSATTTVIDTTAPTVPTINPVTDVATTITGKGEPGATVTVTYPNGDSSTATLQPDGTWTSTIPSTVDLNGGDIVTAKQTDPSGNTSGSATTTVIDTTAPTVPTINPVTDVATTITGKGEPGATVTVTYPNGDTSTATVQPDGTWTSTIPSTVDLNGGDIVTAKQTDPSGNTSGSATTTVIDTTAPTVPTINPVTDVATTITGKGEPGATVTVTYPNGDTSTATVQPDGTWTSTIPSTVDLNGGDIVTAKQTDPSGNTSGSATTIVTTSMTSTNTAPIATATAITTLQDKSVSEKITATDADGDVLTYSTSTNPLHGTLIVNIDGSYKYTPNNNFHGNDSFSVTVSDGKGGIAVATVSVNVLALPKFTKKSSIPVPNVDGTFSWTYTITVNNDTDQRIDSIQVIDDLDKVFRTKGCEYTVTSITASGKLIANGLYKGYNNTGTLIRESSYLEPNTVDSIMIQVTVNSHQFIGEVYNQALLSGYIPSGKSNFSNIVSDDLSLPGVNDSTVTIVPAVALYIPDGFSPNDDAFNQTFVIKHSEATRIDLEVYNRWGNKVYQSSDYQNNWDGKGIGNFLGKDLPAGTYFCTCRQIEISTGKIISNGVKSITLRR